MGFDRKAECRRHNTYDYVAPIPYRKSPVCQIGVPAQSPQPEAVADHDDRRCAGSLFLRQKDPAHDRRDAENAEEIAVDSNHIGALRFAAAGDRLRPAPSPAERRNEFKRLLTLAPVGEIRM